ncbi:MAG TPA: hypothetical protein VF081_02560 [Solirubrobacterales bacterium]
MLSKLHSRLGTAGFIVAIVALIAAVAGTAFAATGLNSKQKKEVKSIAKSVAGTGAPGPAGPAGPAGPKGADGAPGQAGAAGAGVTTDAATLGECPEGGVKINSASGATKVCNGKDGEPGEPGVSGFTETLPPEETETGVWSLSASPSGIPYQSLVSFSFPIPLAAKLPGGHLHFINPNGKEIVANPVTEVEEEEVDSTVCLGSVAAPSAPTGHLCVYTKGFSNVKSKQANFVNPETGGQNENVSSALTGALLAFDVVGEETETTIPRAFGTWAVTACPEAGCTP